MITSITLEQLKALRVLPGGDGALAELYGASIDKLDLSLLDYLTIRDLLELSGSINDTPLTAILFCMFTALNEGSICIKIDKAGLLKRLERFLNKECSHYYADEFCKSLNSNGYENLIGRLDSDFIPVIRRKEPKIDLLYFQKYFVHENSLKERLKQFLNLTYPESVETNEGFDRQWGGNTEEIIDKVINVKPVLLPSGKPIKLDAGQKMAVKIALNQNFAVISGGPGTGKTSILVNILRCMVRTGVQAGRILLAAPTGRAAHRITESVQKSLNTIKEPEPEDLSLKNVAGVTIHRLLKYDPTCNRFLHQQVNPLPAEVVIVDEVSMVDVLLMDNLFRAIDPDDTRVILLGDRDQLPSVEVGAVLADLIPDNKNSAMKGRIVSLKRDYRTKGEISNLCKVINKKTGKIDLNWPEPVSISTALKQGVGKYSIVKCSDRSQYINAYITWADHHYNRSDDSGETYFDMIKRAGKIDFRELNGKNERDLFDKIFNFLEKARILTLIREGIVGCAGINHIILEYLRQKVNGRVYGEMLNGTPILILRNDYGKELFNGDVGVLFQDVKGSYRPVFVKNGDYFSYPLDFLPAYEPAFAMTVHKSQGSEFDNVMLVLPEDERHHLLTREIVYTGLTRARERVVICGSKNALNHAVNKKIKRESGFDLNLSALRCL